MVRKNFWREQDEQNDYKVKCNRSESGHGVPGFRAIRRRLGHQIDLAGGEHIGVDYVGQILDGHNFSRLEFGRMRVFRHGDARIENGQRNVVGCLARRIERSVRHVARNDNSVAKHFQLKIRGDRGVRV